MASMEDFTTKIERTEAFWADFCQATGVEGDYDAVAFGDSVALANELAALVLKLIFLPLFFWFLQLFFWLLVHKEYLFCL